MDLQLKKDLQTLGRFIEVYCQSRHDAKAKSPARIKILNVEELMGHSLQLCPACQKLLTHAFVKRSRCPMSPKPACKHCPDHCYHPAYRQQIREVMKFSGRKLVLHGRLDYLFHLLF